MTESVMANQDETKKDNPTPSSPKTTSKVGKHTNDGNERSKPTEKVERPPTKVVVRRLPPTMSLETFLDQVAPLPPVDFMYFVKADSSLAPNSFGRAYLHFIHVADLLIFTEKFDNYVFVDSKGNEYPAIVEYAPFQRIPKQRSTRKKDPRIGTIDNDPFYQEFIETLKAEETQRKSASKTNKQHFFETSASTIAPKVTSTPLLEFLRAKRADKLRTKEDKIAERRKREMERRKIREDARTAVKQRKTSEGDSEISASPAPQIKPPQPSIVPNADLAEIQTRYLRCMIGLDADTSGLEKIAGHGTAGEKFSRDTSDLKRSSKDGVQGSLSKRREDDRIKNRDKEKREKEDREHYKDVKRDTQRDSGKDQGFEKDKENQPAVSEARLKENRRGCKSYQEERQRLNERRQATKTTAAKSYHSGDGHKTDKGDGVTSEDNFGDKKASYKKEVDATADSRNRSHDKFRNSDQYKQQTSKERKFEKPSKTTRDQDQRRSNDSKKNSDDHSHESGKDFKKTVSNDKKHEDKNTPVSLSDLKAVETDKSSQSKEEVRKKSYNQEREQRRAAADRKSQNRRDSVQSSKSEEKISAKLNLLSKDTLCVDDASKQSDGTNTSERERRPSLDSLKQKEASHDEPSRSKSLADIQTLKASTNRESTKERKKENSSRGDEKDKKDPRVERRIRNKDRPSIEIYRPGMGRFSRQRLEREKGLNKGSSTERDSPSSSPSPVPSAAKTPVITENTNE